MHKKEAAKAKKQQTEDKVEDIYGVHFKYQDLFSRLLKVQKQRQMSEEKQKIPRMSSFDNNNVRQASVHKVKKVASLSKKTASVRELKVNQRSISVKKIALKVPATDRKSEIFKSYSPSQKRTKKPSIHVKSTSKKIEKKSANTARIIKKHITKARDH
jgi:hypothetical protein